MAGQASVTIPEILAGPILQRVTPSSLMVWLATTKALDPRKVQGEVWDPLPDTHAGFVPQFVPALGLTGSLITPYDVEVRSPAQNLFFYRVTLKADRGEWPANRALAYRIAPVGTDWIVSSHGVEPLPGDRGPAAGTRLPPGSRFAYPWFVVDPAERRWSVMSIPGAAPAIWIDAETYLSRLARGSTRPRPTDLNPRGPNAQAGRPTTALLLGADAIPQDEGAVRTLAFLIGQELENPRTAEALCGYLLALSPALWQLVADGRAAGHAPQPPPPPAPATALNLARCTALAKIAAHLPLYGIPSAIMGITDLVTAFSAKKMFATCFLWGNAGEDLVNPDVGEVTEKTKYVTGEPPYVRVFLSAPDELAHPKESRTNPARVFPFLAVSAPPPVLPIAPPSGYQRPSLGAYDNLFAIGLDGHAYLNTPAKQIDDGVTLTSADRTVLRRTARAYSTLAAQRIYQLAVAAIVGPNPPRKTRDGSEWNWNPRQLQYASGSTVDMLISAPTFSVLSSEPTGNRVGYRLTLFASADHGRTVALMRTGHRVLPKAQADVWIGNRFRLPSSEDDEHHLGGIDVLIDGQKHATTTQDGLATGLLAFLSTLGDGRRTLSIDGPNTDPNPPGPSTGGSPRRRVVRLWRQRTFEIVVRDGQIVQVDDELVASPGVRILIDPIYMRLVSGISTGTPTRVGNQPVSMFIVHRPENANAVGLLSTWQKTVQQRQTLHPAENPHTAAAYLLAKDGTLIKGADDDEVVNHSSFGHWTKGNPPQAGDTQQMSVGVEICKFHDDPNPYTEAQYAHLLWLLGQYVTSPPNISPLDIVGHGDVKDDGRDDPGLAFEWALLEAAGFGLRRAGAPLVSPYAPFPPAIDFANRAQQQVRQPTPQFQASITADLADVPYYQKIFQRELALPAAQQIPAIDRSVNNMLREIGYHQSLDRTINNGHPAHLSFRSHFFSGSRRLLFALRAGSPNSDDRLYEDEQRILLSNPDMWRLTAVWVARVRDFVVAERQASNPRVPIAAPVPPAPR